MQPKDEHITFTDEEAATLERVRQQQGLACIEQAAHWLVKSRMRRQVKQLTGRGPAMYLVHGSKS